MFTMKKMGKTAESVDVAEINGIISYEKIKMALKGIKVTRFVIEMCDSDNEFTQFQFGHMQTDWNWVPEPLMEFVSVRGFLML